MKIFNFIKKYTERPKKKKGQVIPTMYVGVTFKIGRLAIQSYGGKIEPTYYSTTNNTIHNTILLYIHYTYIQLSSSMYIQYIHTHDHLVNFFKNEKQNTKD